MPQADTALAIEGTRATGSPHRRRLPTTAIAAAVVVAIAVASLAHFLTAGSGRTASAPAVRSEVTTESRIASLQQQLRGAPDRPSLLVDLGLAYLTRARETADPTFYAKSAEAVERAHSLDPTDTRGLISLGLVQLARHDFAGALASGREALGRTPASAAALGVVTDALVESGRYDDAVDSVQRMVDLRPDIASYARVSYVRELFGDVAGARVAMQQAVTAGADVATDVAYVRTLLGDLELGQARLDAAETAYRAALTAAAGYGQAEVGLARVAAARGDVPHAIAILEPVATRLPLPDSVALLGDLYSATGRSADAARQYDLVRAIEALNRANGISVDLELARFEADHARDPGADASAAVALARQALAARPTVYGHDILGWALRQAGRAPEALAEARAAVALGTSDGVLWYHLAATEADAGNTADAVTHLQKAFAINRHLTVGTLPDARRLAARLGVEVPS